MDNGFVLVDSWTLVGAIVLIVSVAVAVLALAARPRTSAAEQVQLSSLERHFMAPDIAIMSSEHAAAGSVPERWSGLSRLYVTVGPGTSNYKTTFERGDG